MLDEQRKQSALARVKLHTDWLRYYEDMAAAERSKISILTRTWQLCPKSAGDNCCGLPLECGNASS